MRQVARHLAERGAAFDTVVHVGAGAGTELEAYRDMGARRIVLVEANPELAAMLRRRVDGMPGAQVRAVAVAAHEGEALLHLFNNSRESSLCMPERLLRHFPNLRQAGDVSVPAMRLDSLLREVDADRGAGNLLVIDVVGIEPAVLAGCAPEVLHAWSHVALRSADEALHAGGADAATLGAALALAGYRQDHAADDTVAPFRELLFVRDEAAVARLQAARAALELEALRADCAARARELEACRAAAAHERAEHARMGAALALERDVHAECARQAQEELERRAGLEHARAQRLRACAVAAIERAALAPSDAAAPDAEAMLADCLDRILAALAHQERRLETERATAAAAQRALRALEQECARQAERELALRADLERAADERTALAAEIRDHLARQERLETDIGRAEARVGAILGLLAHEADS